MTADSAETAGRAHKAPTARTADLVDVAVVGAGIVGGAVARALAVAGLSVTVVDGGAAAGRHVLRR